MRRFIVAAIASLVVAAFAAVPGRSLPRPATEAQPNQNCETSSSAPPGFGTAGFANAQSHYAAGGANNNPKAVSQYDVACFQLSSHSG